MDYIVEDRGDGRGLGVYALRTFVRGELIAKISGEIVSEHRLHSLQLDDCTHLNDPSFTGRLLHDCEPNAEIDIMKLEVTAVREIKAGEAVTIDYAKTEDRLVRQFACACGSPACRRWITGRKEEVNAEGKKYLCKI